MTFGRKPPGQGGAPLGGGEVVTVERTEPQHIEPAPTPHRHLVGAPAPAL
ncbi:hypothetical protein Q3V23_32075 [Streptomyces sp. VNUA116]|nr:hypothetical protein [Streptomyces sp. VNUA116]WKU48334.1 hypothetical protein Q3V23_32075 [Streptomyces sp. VNUA116]